MSRVHMLSIEIDGHFHGGPPFRPWAARIAGPCPKYGLAREFVEPKNDYRDARTTWRRTYGIVSYFPLYERQMYEVGRCRGRPSKRYIAREFLWVEGGETHKRTPDDALAWAEGVADPALAEIPAVTVSVREGEGSWVAEIVGVGTPAKLGFALVDGVRRYRLHEGRMYEIDEGGRRRMVMVRDGEVEPVGQEEAIRRLAQRMH